MWSLYSEWTSDGEQRRARSTIDAPTSRQISDSTDPRRRSGKMDGEGRRTERCYGGTMDNAVGVDQGVRNEEQLAEGPAVPRTPCDIVDSTKVLQHPWRA